MDTINVFSTQKSPLSKNKDQVQLLINYYPHNVSRVSKYGKEKYLFQKVRWYTIKIFI